MQIDSDLCLINKGGKLKVGKFPLGMLNVWVFGWVSAYFMRIKHV